MASIPGCGTPSSRCGGKPLVQALLVPHNRADHPATDHKAVKTSLKERRNSKGREKESIHREKKRRGRKGIRKDMSQLLCHFSEFIRRTMTVSRKNYIFSLLSKLRLAN